MSWDEVTLSVARAGHISPAQVRFTAEGPCQVEVRISSALQASGVGGDLFEALAGARRILEASGFLLICNGARCNVFPSPMMRQAISGRRAYELSMPRTANKPPVVDIFAPAELVDICTVDEQVEWHSRWVACELH